MRVDKTDIIRWRARIDNISATRRSNITYKTVLTYSQAVALVQDTDMAIYFEWMRLGWKKAFMEDVLRKIFPNLPEVPPRKIKW